MVTGRQRFSAVPWERIGDGSTTTSLAYGLVHPAAFVLPARPLGAALQPDRADVHWHALLLLVPASAGARRRRADRHHLFRHRKKIRTGSDRDGDYQLDQP